MHQSLCFSALIRRLEAFEKYKVIMIYELAKIRDDIFDGQCMDEN